MFKSTPEVKPLHANESIKAVSRNLRGTLADEFADCNTGNILEDTNQLLKFHGSYQQDDRDQRAERRAMKLEKAWQFMVRVRIPGGVCTPRQWLTLDRLADSHANGTLKLTTRQTIQLHGIIKSAVKPTMRELNQELLDCIAACGDVNRNVMCNPNPLQSELHEEVYDWATRLSLHLLPKTRAYHEIWLDEAPLTPEIEPEIEPIYGKTYLPRKFKIVVAVPPSNDVDIYAHDLGCIAIAGSNGRLTGFNLAVGGGMGMSHGKEATFPRLGDVIGYTPKKKLLQIAEEIVKIQRDFGDRNNRAHARLKYTIEDRGVEWFVTELTRRLGFEIEPARPFAFDHNGDRFGWIQNHRGDWHLTLFIQNGRLRDVPGQLWRSALREIAQHHTGDFRLTANQNLIIGGVTPDQKPVIEGILQGHNLHESHLQTGLRLHSLACVSLPTCGLGLAESERYLPTLLNELDAIVDEAGLRHDAITIRMTGCANGCARPYLAEIGLVGRAPGKYNLYLGGGFSGQRLNKLYRASLPDTEIARTLRPIIDQFAKERKVGEHFGDFVIRAGYVAATVNGRDFHASIAAATQPVRPDARPVAD